MLGSFLRGPSAETTTLETIGLIKGVRPLDKEPRNALANLEAGKMARQIGRVLGRESKVLDRDVATFLNEAKRGLERLTDTPSAMPTGRYGPAGTAKLKANPAWFERFDAFAASLDDRATAIFDNRYAADLTAPTADKSGISLWRREEPGLVQKIGMTMGRV